MQLPIDAVRYSDITMQMKNHIQVIDGVQYIQVHPTFLYESLWNIMILVLMLLWSKHKRFDGEIFMMYLFGYGVGRFWIEGLRTDALLIPKTNLPVSQLLAVLLVIASATVIIMKTNKKKVPEE
jgi:phosphatidylglycerol:prolipoprotein diacylglycerol transferase